jgi:hypothetical protein
MIFTKCFDINTGDIVDLAREREVVDALDYSYAYAVTPVDFSNSNIDEFGDPYSSGYYPYTPPDGSVITKAWILARGLVCISITEPDGRVLYVSFYNTRLRE